MVRNFSVILLEKTLPFKSRVYKGQVRQNDDFRTFQSPRQDI